MSNYIPQSGSAGSTEITKQEPAPLPGNAYDRISTPHRCSGSKTPNYVIVTTNFTNTCGFFFGNSGSFHALQSGSYPGSGVTASAHYATWGAEATLNEGDRLDIHPYAWSGSIADEDKLLFVYKSGLSTGGF